MAAVPVANFETAFVRATVSVEKLVAEIDKKQILLQSVIELIHNATLIHDDIIDESDVRRNLPTFNKKFHNSIAVIAGDY